MTNQSRSESARLSFRVTLEQKALIERAASVNGRTVTGFAVATLVRAARETIAGSALTTLSARDAESFLRMLDADAAPIAALKVAAKRYRGRGGES